MASKPLYLTEVPMEFRAKGDGAKVSAFTESSCRITKESLGGKAGELVTLRPWQKNLFGQVYARREDGRLRARRALIGMPRKNGKSAVGSSLAIYGLTQSGDGAEVYSCAADKEQARIVFGVAKRMVELDPVMSKGIKVYRDVLEYRDTGSTYKVLSAEAYTKEGLNPSVVLFDEIHAQPNDELYDVMSNAFGARRDPLLIMITTAGVRISSNGDESVAYRLYKYGVDVASGIVEDPSFFMAWWGAPEGANASDPAVWAAANPGLGDLVDPEDLASNYAQARAKGTVNDFKTKRLNMWVNASTAWMPDGMWNACATMEDFTVPQRGVVLGFDGSRSGDDTALVAVTVEAEPKVKVLGYWTKPKDDPYWTVPRGQVRDTIRKAIADFGPRKVQEVAYDEYLWQDAMDDMGEEYKRWDGEPMFVGYPQTSSRLAPATQRFFELVQNRRLRHDGDTRLARHVNNAVLKVDERGARIVKDARMGHRRIDLAVASVMAIDRAAYWLGQPAPVEGHRYVW